MTNKFDNAPELGSLSLEEHASVEAARGAIMALKKTFEHWLTVMKGLETLRHKADRLGGRQTFKRLREQAGLGNKIIPDATMTRGFAILERLPEVMQWRQGLSDRQQYEWASPSAVFKHCPVFATPKPTGNEKPMTPAEKDRQALAAALEQIEKLKRQLHDNDGGNHFSPKDTAKDIATVLVNTCKPPSKAEEVARLVLKMLKGKS